MNARLFIRLLLTLIVIISMFIFYSNKCICTSVLFVFLDVIRDIHHNRDLDVGLLSVDYTDHGCNN